MDSVTRFVRKLDLALEIRDLTKLHWALNFLRSKGDFQRRHDRSSRLLSRVRFISRLHYCVIVWVRMGGAEPL